MKLASAELSLKAPNLTSQCVKQKLTSLIILLYFPIIAINLKDMYYYLLLLLKVLFDKIRKYQSSYENRSATNFVLQPFHVK